MSNHLDESLEKVLNGLPGRVSNQLLLGAIIETRTQLRNDVNTLSERVLAFETRLTKAEQAIEEDRQNPSLIWVARNRPVELIKIILIILGIAGVTHVPNWLSLIITHFGG